MMLAVITMYIPAFDLNEHILRSATSDCEDPSIGCSPGAGTCGGCVRWRGPARWVSLLSAVTG